ncbi:hypothetical protein CVT25_003195 [Psilocybe cyanescens]|uniref:Uncharacterized protein n=1 Tax=Psilocybe cyanescens TaxID=93625 RepID=A0A409XEZ1_PSICY|nr:hypothetical protein CVT25_003195 [Psilocybe cyanescens]
MTSTPSNISALHKTAEEDRHHDIHPSASPHTSDVEVHQLGHSSRHASHTTHTTEKKVPHAEEHREIHPTFAEKIQGFKEELQGKITHNPELVKHGKNLMTGAVHNEGWHGLHDQASANINSDGERQELTGNTPKAEFAKPL